MTLNKIYKRSVIYTGIVFLPCITIFSIIENRNYESEWMTGEAVIQMTITIAILYWALMSILSLTMLLNKYHEIRSNIVLSVLSWFLLPGILICIVIGKANNEYLTVGSTEEIVYALLFNLPFVAGLIWGFWKFKRLSSRSK